MQEELKKVTSNSVEAVGRSVTLCIRSQRIRLNGTWNWEMLSPAVYCSDVMSFPDQFTGTKGLIHPDDLPKLIGALTMMEDKEVFRLDFRIITTYGEVRTISGYRVSVEDEKNNLIEPIPGKEPWEEALQLLATQKENDFLKLRNELTESTERLHGIGSWLVNRQSGQAWYSDNVFRIHGLAPQTLNAHANTFNQFIHKDDRITVLDAFEKAYEEHAPLHIEYRIVLQDGQIRYVQQITKWFYSLYGQEIFSGIIRDVTGERAAADELLAMQSQSLMYQQVLKMSDQQAAAGYWLMNLATRKTSYSENYYRIYGFKQSFLPSYNSFLNFVHSDDRAKVNELIEKIYNEHALPETEFRIIRPDGRLRYVKQCGKLFISPNKELYMIGVVQDISVQKGLEKKILELNENVSLNKAVMDMMENAVEAASFIWLPDGYMQWSEGFYKMLGYRPGGVEPLPRFVYKNIHPADIKTFKNAEALLLNHQAHDDIFIRFVLKGRAKKVRISFQQLNYGKDATIALVHDISKQTELNEQFAGNKFFTELLEESVNDMIVFTNIDNTIMHWNRIAEEKTGITKDDALHHNLFEILPRLNEESFLGQLHLAFRGNEGNSSRVTDVYLRRPHDYWLWPLKNETDDVIGVLHVIHDISKQLELQQQLNERLNFIESLIEASVDRIVVLDRFMNYLYWNKKAEEYYAISKERVLGKNILEVFPSFRNNPGYQQFRMVLKGETVYLPPSAEEPDEYFETYLIPVKDDSGDVTAVLWVVHDLSREYQLAKERKQTADLLQATIDASKEMIQVFEAVRDEHGKIIDFRWTLLNHEAEKWMPDAIGKSLLQTQPGVIEEGIFDTFKTVVETGIPDQSEIYYVHEQFNGWFYQSTVKLNDGVATITRDITGKKKAEEQILHLKDEVAQKANDKYYSLFNSVDDGFAILELVFDENGKPVDFIYQETNPAFIKHVGMDLQGRRRSELFSDEKDSLLEKCEHLSKTGESIYFEYVVHGLGDQWFQVTASRIGEEGSKQLGVVFRNITERKQRERLQEFLLKLSDALRPLSDPLEIQRAAMQVVGEFLEVDCALYKEIRDDGQTIRIDDNYVRGDFQKVTGDFPVAMFGEAMEVLRRGQILVIEDLATTPLMIQPEREAGMTLGIFASVSIPLIKEGRWVAGFCMFHGSPRKWTKNEITILQETAERTWAAVERAKAEEQLKNFATTLEKQVAERTEELQQRNAELENFKRITDGAHDAIISLDADGSITYWNDAAKALYGYSEDEVGGRQLTELSVPAHKLEEWNDLKITVLERGEAVIDLETQRITKEGKLIDVLMSIFPLKDDGKIVGSCGIAKDITERKKWEEEIKKNVTILQHTEQLAQTGSWEYEISTGNFRWSEGMYKLFGLPERMEVHPEIYLESAVEEDRSVAKRIISNLKKKYQPFEEIMKIKKDNEYRLLKIKGSVIADEKGSAQKVIGVDLDITDIQKAEEKLKESERWLEQTAKVSPDSISIYDLQTNQPFYLNDCLSAWVDMDPDELVEIGVEGRLKLIHPDDRLQVLHFNERVAATNGDVLTMEYRVINKDGKSIWLRNRSRVFQRDASGNVTHLLTILQNVTEEVELREQLKQRTQFAEAILDASVDRITVFDQEYKFVGWNKRCEQIHRKSKEEVMGKTIFEIFPGVEKYPEFINSQVQSLKGEFVHVPMVRDGYTGDYLELFYIPLKNVAGETYAVVNIMHDVSNYVMTTEALNMVNKKLESKNVELEQKNEEITSFAFIASHDMKEPLRKIHTFSDWLLEQEMGSLSPKGKGLVEKIDVSVRRMEILIDDILVLTRIHSDTHREEEVDLNKILQQVLDDISDQILQTGTVINVSRLPVIKGNSNQLFYLFKNLLDNAIKFQKPGTVPEVTITSEIASGDEVKINEPREGYLKLSFIDNGFGFEQRYTKKIFQVFQRLHGKHEFEGTGIGLAICKKIMENHNGMITAQSELGKGSVFSCYFPLH